MNRSIHAVRISLALALAASLGCGSNAPELAAISISPATATVEESITQQFTATVTGTSNTAVTWLVSEQGGGTITSSGLYTAPAVTGTFHVVATSLADSSKTAKATITVTSAPPAVTQISVSPTSVSVPAGTTQQFTAQVNAHLTNDVTWTVASGGAGGTIGADGVYTAPATLGSDTVTATSILDPTKSASAAVTVIEPAPEGLVYSPSALVCTLGRFCALPAPTSTGGAIASFTIAPALPTGISLNQTTGVISGTAGQLLNTTSYMVTAINAGGQASAAITLAVNAVPPSQLAYSESELDCFVNDPCTLAPPTSLGGQITSYAIEPQLTGGLVFNSFSGGISGTPTAALAPTNFLIIAANSGGEATVNLVIYVQDLPPTALSYSPANLACTLNTLCTGPTPTTAGGQITSYAISPALPDGLALDAHTGIVAGTPTALQASAAYTITGSNTGGMLTTTLNIAVNDVPPSQLSYGTPTLTCTIEQPCSLAAPGAEGGPIISFTVSPALPAGLALGADGAITGTPTAITAAQTYTITATNSGGQSMVTLTIAVNDVPPSQLSYGSGGGSDGGSGGGSDGGAGSATASLRCVKGTFCSLAAPSSSGGTVVSFASNPQLPAGLTLNSDGSISGTPTVVAATANYVITATNSGGQTSATISITVIDIPPASITYSPNSLLCVKGSACSLAAPSTTGGAVVAYSSNPTLPAGLLLASSGAISGTPSAVAASAVYTITGTNSGGQVTTTVTVQVNDIQPAQFAYSPSSLTCTKGAPCSSAAPTDTGGAIVSYSANPTLPAGLSFASNGAIQGTPTALSPSASYTITGTNSGGSISTPFTLAVNDVPPSHITYSTASLVCTRGTPCSLAAPANSGGPTTSFTSSPNLPAGLSFNTSGAISGTPTAPSANTAYTIMAINSGGSATTTLNILVNDAAPTGLTYSSSTLTCIKATPCSIGAPTYQGVVTSFTVNPALPTGLTLNSDGSISGTPPNLTASQVYTIAANNSAGQSTENLTIAVIDNPPAGLAYSPSSVTCQRTFSCTVNAPASTGAPIVSYSVSPSLPSGLTFNTTNGSVAGTPTVISAAVNYTVTATNSGGSTQATFSLTILDLPPTSVVYTPASELCTKGAPCNFAAPAVSGGGPATFFSVSPALPAGLAINSATGAISGNPSAIQATTNYAVAASNSGGNAPTVTISITVLEPLTTFGATSLAGGSSSTCAMANGGAYCWGNNGSGQLGNNTTTASLLPVPVSGLSSGVEQLATQFASVCAVVNGGVQCWGNNGVGQLGNNNAPYNSPVPVQVSGITTGATAVTSSEQSSCALVNGGVKCWGSNASGQLGNNSTASSTVPVAVTNLTAGVQAIASTSFSTCAVQNGVVLCWGQNQHGEIGNNTTNNVLVPTAVATITGNVDALTAGEYHFCALVGGAVYCWGNNDFGEIGNNSTVNALFPVKNTFLGNGIRAIAGGQSHTCALANGGVQCWGWNVYGQLGNNSTANSLTPLAVAGLTSGVQQLSAGLNHTCAIVNGAAQCWGDNASGQLGTNTTANALVPTPVTSMFTGNQSVAVGQYHGCAIVNGGVQCWGENNSGQLGNNSTVNSSVPVTVFNASSGATQLAAGYEHTCALINGGVQCWGYNANGQLGNGNTNPSMVPVQVSGLTSGVEAISSGWSHSCALMNDSGVKCWGSNSNGQLGNNTAAGTSSSIPVSVSGLSAGVQQLASSQASNCALVNGGLKCWGDNSVGELGNNSTAATLIPVSVPNLSTGVQQISPGGYNYFCAAVNGGAQCWGFDGNGQLGNNTATNAVLVPTQVTNLPAGSGVQSIAGGLASTCAVVNGGAQCWGTNTSGCLGNNTQANSFVPVKVAGAGGAGVTSISVGTNQTCAMINGNVQCWGYNFYGELGNNSTANSLVPAPILGPIGYLPQ